MGRFISADTLVSTGQGILGNNMFAYCRNNPVCRIDISGTVDVDCQDDDPLDQEDVLETDRGGGGNQASNSGGTVANSPSLGSSRFSLVKFLKGLLNRSGQKGDINISASEALDLAIQYLGPGYQEVSPGRYVNGNCQVRMQDGDLSCTYDSPHINFDTISPYKTVHVYFYEDNNEVLK